MMTVSTKVETMTKKQAQSWIEQRGIERLPRADERLEYIPPCSFNQYDLEREGDLFLLTSSILH
jgi:hypothetical protein